ncbi:c2803f32-47d3-4753-9c79-ab4e77111a27 [Thermothielavioides terrestris]|uniref:C2803f32-47d3-4753-9c79-ab4e77111a27 n=1 Tax=Thermothielavioides terrestris TaxID=2587410 RepID=A0A446BKL7_9PEZI|nr:c2803f32-47d3-4753-9c79-ab4e77111a27 [Thermothielavioides terrestris]
MKVISVAILLLTAAYAAPIDSICGSGKRDVGLVTRALHSVLEDLKDKREVSEVDVDEISQALYATWCTP